jgi:hypothetical protein
MCSILSNENIMQRMQGFLNRGLAFIFSLLYKQKIEESEKLKKTLKKELECNFIGDSDEDDEDEDTGQKK